MKKDVLFMCQFFYPEYISSALLPFQTAEALKDSGLSVDVLCGFPKEYIKDNSKVPLHETVDGINIYRKKYLQLSRSNFFGRIVNYFSFTFMMLMNILKCKKYKVIIVYSNPPILPLVTLLARKLFKCKIIFVTYDLYPEIAVNMNAVSDKSFISRVMSKINKNLFREVSRVVSLSEDMKNYILNNRGVDAKKVSVIHNWATEELHFSEVQSIDFKNLRKKYKLIVSYFGNMGTAQDINTILKLINDQRIKEENICFLFAGHGNKREEIESLIQQKQLSNSIIFDYLSGSDFEDALNITDIFMVSLEKNIAGLAVPSKTYSYYQSGKPVIAIMDKNTDISKEICKNNAGLAVENGETEPLIEWLLSIVKDETQLVKMNKNVQKMFNNLYTKDLQLEKYVKLVYSVLEE